MVRYAASFTVDPPSTPSTRINTTPVARREQAIQRGLSKRLAQLAAERERRERAAAKADAEFSAEFLSMARKCFDLIDKDGSGTLEKPEMSARSVRRVWGGSYAIDATRRLPRDPPAACRPSGPTRS